MAVIFFLFLIVLVAGVWALIAYVRAGAKAADTGIDRTNGPAGPSLLEEDLSFAGRDDAPADTGGEATQSESVDDRAVSSR